ncbi:MAG: hypothetical protein FJZ59_04025 [Chlamydiae bacterium]|nr:hypothetical protein [Chlamydiota bacterium]
MESLICAASYYGSGAAEEKKEEDIDVDRFVPEVRTVDSLIGMARPGYLAHNAKRGWEIESREIDDTLGYIYRKGVTTIISLSNQEYHDTHDSVIEERWKRLGPSHKFYHILNKDNCDPGFCISQGPTQEKIKRFLKILREEKGRVAVYCGEGHGRTCCYLISHLIEKERLSPDDAFNLFFTLTGQRLKTKIKDEIESNGGFKALADFYKVRFAKRR